MNPQDIRAELKKMEYTFASLGREMGVQGQTIGQVVDGKARSAKVEERISRITGIPLYRLWPQWHDAPAGLPKDFDPLRLNVQLLEFVERLLAERLARHIPGLSPTLRLPARHRVAIYNACVDRGTAAIETTAGIAEQVDKYLDDWAEIDYVQVTGGPPDSAAWRRQYLYPETPAPKPAAAPSVNIAASGPGSKAAGRDIHEGPAPRKPR